MGIFDAFKTKPVQQVVTEQPKTILVADDEQYLREFYAELLTQQGYKVVTATNGQEAVNIAIQLRPNLILLDLMMPVMDGNEALRKLNGSPQTKDIPIIVLTNAGNMGNMDNAKLYSAYQFLIKANISPEEVLKSVQEGLQFKPQPPIPEGEEENQ